MAISVITPVAKSLRTKSFPISEGTSVQVVGLRGPTTLLGVLINSATGAVAGTLDLGYASGTGDEILDGVDLSTAITGGNTALLGVNLGDKNKQDQIIEYTLVGTGAGGYTVTLLFSDD